MSDILEAKKKSDILREQEIENNVLKSENTKNSSKTHKISQKKDKKISKQNKIITGLSIATALLAVSTIGFGIGFAITDSKAMEYKTNLENVYQSNFYSLLDSVNNLETKVSKTL